MKKKKILFYNWDYLDGNEGGGVTVYSRNLISNLRKDKNYEIFYFNSGISYDTSKKLKIKRIKNSISKEIKTYTIVNSPILAPSHHNFYGIKEYLTDTSLYEILKKFILKQGGFDIIHFNNLEGLSVNVLKLKEDFPKTKFIFSVHNYFLFCPQVNLWNKEKLSCDDYCSGKECLDCLVHYYDKNRILSNRKIEFIIKRLGINKNSNAYNKNFNRLEKIRIVRTRIKGYDKISKQQNPIKKPIFKTDQNQPKLYMNFRETNVKFINKYIDTIIAVSFRVKEICEKYGLDNKKLNVKYIGTKVADKQIKKNSSDTNSTIFKICYLGYMRRDKGFYFLLDSLKHIPPEYAKNISILLAARCSDENVFEECKQLGKTFYSIELYDGYSHNDFDFLFKDVNLGIVPVLWEDCLPQVALEYVANGIPILTSSSGGAKELCNNNNFIFECGNTEDFVKKLCLIFDNRNLLNQFFLPAPELTTMNKHIEELKKIYFST